MRSQMLQEACFPAQTGLPAPSPEKPREPARYRISSQQVS